MPFIDWRNVRMVNNVVLMGRLTRNPELRQTPSGASVCNFSVAVDNGYGENKKTDFINCVTWNKTAEFVCNYFTKGQMIALTGRITTRTWDDNGATRYATEVWAREVSFCGSKNEGQNNDAEGFTSGIDLDGFVPIPSDDDLPF